MASAIEGALAERGVLTRGAHEKFAVVVAQESDFGKLTPPLWDLAVRLGAREGQTLAPGMVNFPDTDLSQVLRFYQELVGRTIVRPAALPAGTVRLKTRARHTYHEVVYALNATLALNNLSILPAGENFLLVVPNHQTNQAANW